MYTLTKIKTFTGREGYGLNATLCLDGKPVAFICDDASGGPVDYDFSNPLQTAASYQATGPERAKREEAAFDAFLAEWVKTNPEALAHEQELAEASKKWKDGRGDSYVGSMLRECRRDSWVNRIADEHAAKKQLDRWAKKKTLFRLPDDEAGKWRTLGVIWGDQARQWIAKKYPNVPVEVYNETRRVA